MAKQPVLKNYNPPAHSGLMKQMVNLLNRTSQVSPEILDQAGHKQANPILAQILRLGYNQGFEPAMSDNDAISQAIRVAREGYGINHPRGFLLQSHRPDMPVTGNASQTLIQSLLDQRVKAGVSLPEAIQSLHDDLQKENFTLKDTQITSKEKGLSDDEKAILTARRAKAAGIVAPEPKPGPNVPIGIPGLEGSKKASLKLDPVKTAMRVQLGHYTDLGQQDIDHYYQQAQMLSGLVPDTIKPLFASMVNNRIQQMQGNLDLYQQQMLNTPKVQALANRAKDLQAKAHSSGSSGDKLSAALSRLGYKGGTSGAGQAGGASKGALDGSASGHSEDYYKKLTRQIAQQLAFGRKMSSAFNTWEEPVIGAGQFTQLNHYVPHTQAAYNRAPSIMDYFTAMSGVGNSPTPSGPYG